MKSGSLARWLDVASNIALVGIACLLAYRLLPGVSSRAAHQRAETALTYPIEKGDALRVPVSVGISKSERTLLRF